MALRGRIQPETCSICQNNVGVFYYRQKLFAPAKAKYELALALRPDRVQVHGDLGLVMHGMGDVDGAMRHIRIALDASPRDPKNLTSMAYVLLTLKRHSEAMTYLERAYAIAPTYAPAVSTSGSRCRRPDAPRRGSRI